MAEEFSLPCPACTTPLPPETTVCGICLRSRTKQEIMRGYAKLRAEKTRKKRLPYKILAAVVLLAGSGKLFIKYRSEVGAAASSTGEALSRWADDQRDPKNYAFKEGAAPPAAAAAPVAAAPPASDPVVASKVVAPPAPKPAPINAWRVSGRVYDLLTLKPIAGAMITFDLAQAGPVRATSDEKGVYEADLPKADGWTVSLMAPGYRAGQLVDIDPPYRVRDHDERQAAMNAVSEGDLMPLPVSWKRAASKGRLDLFAVPPLPAAPLSATPSPMP
jgi:hypothetical protein